MFAFDRAALPRLTTRRALIAVDFQAAFTDPDGALPVVEPEGYVERAANLAAAFREAGGDVVWVTSHFEAVRPAGGPGEDEPIVASAARQQQQRRGRTGKPAKDATPGTKPAAPSPASASSSSSSSSAAPDPPPDPEAFLSHPSPAALRPDSPGCSPGATIRGAMDKADAVLHKTHYSAFRDTQLLRLLRGKMAMEVFLCGSLANVGVYATALDAAGHGLAITVVDDCCGYRDQMRQLKALRNLGELTGCEVATAAEVLETVRNGASTPGKSKVSQPSPRAARPSRAVRDKLTSAMLAASSPSPPSKSPAIAAADEPLQAAEAKGCESPDITRSLAELSLAPKPPARELAAEADTPATMIPADEAESRTVTTSKVVEASEKPKTSDSSPQKKSNKKSHKPSTKTGNTTKDKSHISTKTSDSGASVPPEQSPPASTTPTKSTSPTPKPPLPAEKPELPKDQSSTAQVMASHDDTSDSDTEHQPQRGLCAGDTDIIEDVLPPSLSSDIFARLRDEISWQRMSHQGGEVPRLVAVQGAVSPDDGSAPVYRHPSDEAPPLLPFSPSVLAIKEHTEKQLGHPLNHVLIQFYRDGRDYISEHSDKTLDIVRGSYIANVSLGAERTMVLRTKRRDKDPSSSTAPTSAASDPPADQKRQVQRARLPHNSLCRMGLKTNEEWLHSIRQDRRLDRDKTPAELAFAGGRISLTFRRIGTFLSHDETLIWGQGATGKTREEAHPVINGQTPEAVSMLRAFGTENHSSTFDWEGHYGKGFDVLHMSSAPRLFACADGVVNMRVRLMLAERGVGFAKGSMGPAPAMEGGGEAASVTESSRIKFVDNDVGKAVVQGDMAIMLYLDSAYPPSKKADDEKGDKEKVKESTALSRPDLAKLYTRFQQGLVLLQKWRRIEKAKDDKPDLKALKSELAIWDGYLADEKDDTTTFIAGPGSAPTLADFVAWPVLHHVVEACGTDVLDGFASLKKYYEMLLERESVQKVLGKAA